MKRTKGDGSKVGEIYLDWTTGTVSGNCKGCNALDVADALEKIARFLKAHDPLNYVDFDEGKLFAG